VNESGTLEGMLKKLGGKKRSTVVINTLVATEENLGVVYNFKWGGGFLSVPQE